MPKPSLGSRAFPQDRCPHCGHRFRQAPSRNVDCPRCSRPVVVRTRPFDRARVLCTPDQVRVIEAEWDALNGADPDLERGFRGQREDLPSRWRDLERQQASWRTALADAQMAFQKRKPAARDQAWEREEALWQELRRQMKEMDPFTRLQYLNSEHPYVGPRKDQVLKAPLCFLNAVRVSAAEPELAARGLAWLVQSCRALETYFDRAQRYAQMLLHRFEDQRNAWARAAGPENYLDLAWATLAALHYLSFFSMFNYPLEGLPQDLAPDLAARCLRVFSRRLEATAEETRELKSVLELHIGFKKDLEDELLPAWESLKEKVLERLRRRDGAARAGQEQPRPEPRPRPTGQPGPGGPRPQAGAGRAQAPPRPEKPLPSAPPGEPRSVKAAYRRLMKLCHPDLAAGAADQAWRSRLALQANLARDAGRLDRLLELLREAGKRSAQ